jgi:ribosome-associated heat shock protein Hsp15
MDPVHGPDLKHEMDPVHGADLKDLLDPMTPKDDKDQAVRLDVWLDVSCLFRTRSEAKRACEGGKVEVNGQPGKAHREIKAGDEVGISRPLGRRQTVVVKAVAERSIPKAAARALYEDRTPPPSREEIEARRMERIFRAMNPPPATPGKRDRRLIRKLKGR